MPNQRNVADFFADLVVDHGVDHVFTVPGGTAMPLLAAISKKASLRTVVAKDETGAAFMADGYAWASGKPGVVITIGGPGATNALTGLCCSAAQGNPVILVSGEVASFSMGRGAVQDGSQLGLDVLAMSRPATALSVSGIAAAQTLFALEEAFRRALLLQRPVHVSLPLDVQRAPIRGLEPRTSRRASSSDISPVDASAVRNAAHVLRRARSLALLIGRGARGAEAELLELAERLGCPVATTCGGKGLFPETHELSLGVFSFGAGPLGRAALSSGLDVLCAVGTRLGEFATMNYSSELKPATALVHIDRAPVVFCRNYSALPVCGEARQTLALLLRELRPERKRGVPDWLHRLRETHSRYDDEPALTSSASPIRPERLMHELERALPRTACVVADIGTSCLFVANCIRLSPPQRSYIPMGWSCMAHPLGASLGVRLGSKEPTVCVTGDAAFLSKGLELHAAVEAQIAGLVWIVLSNNGHGLVRLGTESALGAGHGVEVGDFRVAPDAAGIARSVGAEALRIETTDQIAPALRRAFECDRPCVLDVKVDPSARPPMKDRIEGLHRSAG